MVSKKIEFHEAASLELEAAFDWYLERSEPAAVRFAAEIDEALASIVQAPQRWPPINFGARKFVLRRFPFVIFIESLLCLYKLSLLPTGTGVQDIGKIVSENPAQKSSPRALIKPCVVFARQSYSFAPRSRRSSIVLLCCVLCSSAGKRMA